MQIIIKGKQVPITPQLREKIARKVQKLSRFVSEDTRVEITATEEQTRSAQDRFSVQIALAGDAPPIRSEVSALNLTTALDKVVDKVMSQLERQKKRQTTVRRHHTPGVRVLALTRAGGLSMLEETSGEGLSSADNSLEQEQNEEIWSQVIEIRRLPTRAMNDQEVIEQMEQSGASFLPFYNEETQSVNVMYRLEQGGYGLLVPALE